MNKGSILSRKWAIYALLIVGILTLIVLNFWGWFFIRSVEDRIAVQLQQQLEQTADFYARDIGARYLEMNISTLSPLEEPLNTSLPIALYDYKRQANLQSIFLVSLDQRFSIDENLSASEGNPLSSFPINDSLFAMATVGEPASVELVELTGEYFLTAYAPVFNEFDEITAILVLEAPATLFNTLQFFRRNLALLGFAGFALIILFAGIILLAIRKLFEIEAQLTAQSRLAHLGQMAAMVAHEIRNPLSIIKGSADVLRKKYSNTKDELFDFIPDEIDRLNRLVSDFLQFARKRDPELFDVEPAPLISSLIDQMKDGRIRFECESEAQLKLDPDAFRQIMLNIIENARQAIDKDGSVRISCSERKRPAIYQIAVVDDGKGMNEQTLQQVFDPFFSTRATGSGLGMAITKQLVEQMSGSISVSSKPGKGTTVQLDFPR
ncbi:MAG: two-component system sensor histidine kinase NtrB [Calditrichia bacterium]